jgi:predicted O-methyltransferase YrrM
MGFEYGSGGSTLFLCQRIRALVTVEHDPKWAALVSERLRARGTENVTLQVRPPNADGSDGPRSTGVEYTGMTFRDYVSSIDAYPDDSFDFAFIDGRARVGCFEHAKSKVRPGGFILLDNSERAEYEPIHAWIAANGWATDHRFGPGPYVDYFWRTSFFTRPGG